MGNIGEKMWWLREKNGRIGDKEKYMYSLDIFRRRN